MAGPSGRFAVLRYHYALTFAILCPSGRKMIQYVPVSFMFVPSTDPLG
jgi:hypothetical protein